MIYDKITVNVWNGVESMIIRNFPLDIDFNYPLDKEYNTDKIAFFDIETTGFAAKTSYLYLIGCIYRKDSSLHLIQWFAEDIKEESKLIINFFEFIKDYDLLIHYNGTGFDIPYLLSKCSMLKLDYSFENIQSLDIYKKISSIKKIFRLKNFKQKTIEAFLKINRLDTFSGGELIEVYQNYVGKRQLEILKESNNTKSSNDQNTETDYLLHLLLQHNQDDIKGLVEICPILYYTHIFDKPFSILQAGIDEGQLLVNIRYDIHLPIRVSFGNDNIYIKAYGDTVSISIKIFEGELKFFYDNYKDYYYLPDEDQAIHKSLAIFMDKEYRVKAKPSNSYTKKQGLFVPQYQSIVSPHFKIERSDKFSFIEIDTDFLLQEEILKAYIKHILNHIISTRDII
ncbi:MAG: ribonuclease H-like domain-containing protein [Clostridiales bacterium]|nr:ribonuclease H-like domain-containing protein [Clostridiales bacterium]